MITLVCLGCGASKTFGLGAQYSGQPIEVWWKAQGELCTLCLKLQPSARPMPPRRMHRVRKGGLSDPTLNTPGAHHASPLDTELLSAAAVGRISGKLRLKILRALHDAGPDGRTDWENETQVPGLTRSSSSTRRGELWEGGWVEMRLDDQQRPVRRKTATGCLAQVWVLSDAAQRNYHSIDFSSIEP